MSNSKITLRELIEYTDSHVEGNTYNMITNDDLSYQKSIIDNYIELLQRGHNGSSIVTSYTTGLTVPDRAYRGAVYSPIQNRIYLVPYDQGSIDTWHYIDCSTGNLVPYTHGVIAVNAAYIGGTYCPSLNRIYFTPNNQATETQWHYIDCNIEREESGNVSATDTGIGGAGFTKVTISPNPFVNGDRIIISGVTEIADGVYTVSSVTGDDFDVDFTYSGSPGGSAGIATSARTVIAYTHGATADPGAYRGDGAYSLALNRIYFPPYSQDNTQWHYVDCSDGSIVPYTHGSGLVGASLESYEGAVYSPINKRIYFIPSGIVENMSISDWHYIDENGEVISYNPQISSIVGRYAGGVYAPTQNRIYFVPGDDKGNDTIWHYIDGGTGEVIPYEHGQTFILNSNPYAHGVYSPTNNRIYFVPQQQADESEWHYVDCNLDSDNIISYSPGISALNGAYIGGSFSPTQNRIYLSPYRQSPEANWHYISILNDNKVNRFIAASSVFGN